MRTKRFTSKNHDIVVEEFKDIREFVKISDSRPENSWSHHTEYSQQDREWLMTGWDDKKDEIMSKLSKLNKGIKTKEKKIKEKVYVVNGYYPNVGKALRGNPRCMGKYKKSIANTKIVEILWDPGIAGGESGERITKSGVDLLAKIKSLELAGYRVKLMVQGFKGQQWDRYACLCRITMKEENQPLDLSRIAYPLANAEMLRTWIFRWYEHLPDAPYIEGYGRSLYLWNDKDRKEILDDVNVKPNQYYVNIGTDIDAMFKPLLEGGK